MSVFAISSEGDLPRVGSHTPMVEFDDSFGMLQGKYLQQPCGDQRNVYKGLNRIHGIGDQFLTFVIHALQIGRPKC